MEIKQRIISWGKFIIFYKNWIKMILLWKKIKKRQAIAYLRNGIKFIVRSGIPDLQMINEVCVNKNYNSNLKGLGKNPVVIDIGANIGTFSILIGKFKRNSKIYSYEPFPDNFEILKRNIRINDLEKNIKIFQEGVGGKRERERALFLSEEGNAAHSLFNKTDNFLNIKIVSLKDIFINNKLKYCDFLKMDCEGAEYEILFNTPNKYLKKIKKISLEYHSNGNPQKLKDFLEKKGFYVILENPNSKGCGMIHCKKSKDKTPKQEECKR